VLLRHLTIPWLTEPLDKGIGVETGSANESCVFATIWLWLR
jgi:hypothetical protein